MRFILTLKLMALMAIWSIACGGVFAIVAIGEALLEVGGSVAGALVGQGGPVSSLVDLSGDIIQWGLGLVWLLGMLALWGLKKLVTPRAPPAATPKMAAPGIEMAGSASSVRTPKNAGDPAARILSGMLARKAKDRR